MNEFQVRPERPGDAAVIHAVTESAFRTAPHTSGTEQFIVRELRRAGALTVSLVAEIDGQVVGHVAISPITIDDGTRDWHGLGPVSVAPGLQRGGIGSRLVRDALARLQSHGGKGCALVGDPAFYGRFGFLAEPSLVLPGVPAQYFQVLKLAGPMPRGVVTFHPAFEARG